MNKIITIITFLYCALTLGGVDEQVERQLETSISSYGALSYTTNQALKSIIKFSAQELRRRDKNELANQIESEFREFDGYLIDAVVMNRDIGWFKPLIEWLAITYESIELAIGYEAARALRISDIKTINHGIIVVFRPCYYGEEEFKKHFIHDSKYRGFAPVITYWSSAVACTAALHGAGYYFVCSPGAMLLERIVDQRIAPRVAPKLYNMACTS